MGERCKVVSQFSECFRGSLGVGVTKRYLYVNGPVLGTTLNGDVTYSKVDFAFGGVAVLGADGTDIGVWGASHRQDVDKHSGH